MGVLENETIKKPTVKPGKIYRQIPKVMADIGAIAKTKSNDGLKYKFRGIDDVYNEIQQYLAKHKIFTVPYVLKHEKEERKAHSGATLIYRMLTIQYTVYAEDGSYVIATVLGEAMDSGDKASNKAMSVAHKYALLQLFCIPTIEPKDPENDNPEVADIKPGTTRTTPGPTRANPAMKKFVANQEQKKDSNDPSALDHDYNQQMIGEKCKDAGLDYKEFKIFLNKKQDGMDPPMEFVGDMHGNLSFMAGKPEDVKTLLDNIDKSIVACKTWIKNKAKQ